MTTKTTITPCDAYNLVRSELKDKTIILPSKANQNESNATGSN
jgi:hypothetical protein